MSDRVRAFVALEIEEALRARIAEGTAALRALLPGVRWVRPEGVHLTLRFLGWALPESLAGIETRLREAAAACPPSAARFSSLGMFPERGSPRVLWLGTHLEPSVLELQAACERAAAEAGFDPEERPFRSHLTLGRWSERVRRPELPPLDVGATRLERLVLFRSELRRGGAVYTPLAAFPLGHQG